MIDNSAQRQHEVFFYGLYMDPDMLQQRGVMPRNPRIGKVSDYRLRIGNKATLLRDPGASAHGMLYSLTHAEIHALYWGAGLDDYAAEALLVQTDAGEVPALCCNLIEPPQSHESNPAYQAKLDEAMTRLGITPGE